MTTNTTKSGQPLSPPARKALTAMFITLFLDLVGFSIIFPLFPNMLKYYLAEEGSVGLLATVISTIERFQQMAGVSGDFALIVLFGGVLGSLYSLLQFVCTPIIGSLSDRYGRKPLIVVCVIGLAISYAMWFFAGTFTLLVLSRILGGIMSGNISTATAVVSDVTTEHNRARGMAIIGIAFGVGFIIGPALGGISAMVDLTQHFPGLGAYGVNPFSGPALVAFILTFFNLCYVLFVFEETLPQNDAPNARIKRIANPLVLFAPTGSPGVAKTNLIYFLFLVAFAGMEFSLTFLTVERFQFTEGRNATMFVFVGFILVLMQGGYVRRKSDIIGPKRMALQGVFVTIPALCVIGFAPNVGVLYIGLLLLAVGSAQVNPCLTALASIYASNHEQGKALGQFRSLGALARAVGPFVACLLYWRLGSAIAYYLGALALLLPLLLTATLPQPKSTEA